MKRVEIFSNCLVPTDEPGAMTTAYVGSVLDLDDKTAGELVASGRAAYVAKGEGGKYVKNVKDTTEQHEKAAAAASAKVVDPMANLAAMVGAAVAEAMKAGAPAKQ